MTNSQHKIPKKPSWMRDYVWQQLLNKYNGVPRCEVTGETNPDLLSVDHIVPRSEHGSSVDVNNLQFLRRDINIKKGTNPDPYWSQSFYWDTMPKLEHFRTAQREHGFLAITETYAEYFRRPWTEINGLMYIAAWFVSAGKTLGIPAIAFGLNHLRLREDGRVPRVNRILVLCKERAIRDQIAKDLAVDVVRYGITAKAPRVKVITKGSEIASYISNPRYLDDHDVYVMCIQSLWDKRTAVPYDQPDDTPFLAQFPVIFVDEVHFGEKQVIKLVNKSCASLCFGFTGTPIDGSGRLLERYAILSLYDYYDAWKSDQSVKLLGNDEQTLNQIFIEENISTANIQDRGNISTVIGNQGDPDWGLHIRPVLSIASRVVQYVKECDELVVMSSRKARHRPARAIPTIHYPVHALIVVDTIEVGKVVCRALNDIFESNRDRYPLNLGYSARIVSSDNEPNGNGDSGHSGDAHTNHKKHGKRKRDGDINKPTPLTTDHPWFWAKNNSILAVCDMTDKGARFLIAVDLAREGVNNPLCCVVGIGCKSRSMIEMIQRQIGRQMRSVDRRDENGAVIEVPILRLDIPAIISHYEFDNRDAVQRGIGVALNMRETLSDLNSVDKILEGETVGIRSSIDVERPHLTDNDKLALLREIGSDKMTGHVSTPAAIVARALQSPQNMDIPYEQVSKEKIHLGVEYVKAYQESSVNVQREFQRVPVMPSYRIVLDEDLVVNPDDETLQRHYYVHMIDGMDDDDVDLTNPKERKFVLRDYRMHVRQFYLYDIPKTTSLSAIRTTLAYDGYHAVYSNKSRGKNTLPSEWYSYTGRAMRLVLGVPEHEKLENESKYDKPQHHMFLMRPEIRRRIIEYVRIRLMNDGFIPELCEALQGEY